MPSVLLLKPGSIERDRFGRVLDARSSVTLIISGRYKIVVDSGLEGEEGAIVQALADLGIRPEEIDCIVNTHSHSDHCGNNHLFPRAKPQAVKEGDVIAPGVRILATPGHSLDSICVLVETKLKEAESVETEVVVVIAGDALPTLGNLQKEVPPALHIDRDLAVASMQRIMALADFVVPGHDFPFSIQKKAYVPIPFRIVPGEGGCSIQDP